MALRTHGRNILDNEVTNIGEDGFWILYDNKEYFISFEDYPVFKDTTVKDIYSMKVIAPGQLRWECLDCDIEIIALESPYEYPLIYK